MSYCLGTRRGFLFAASNTTVAELGASHIYGVISTPTASFLPDSTPAIMSRPVFMWGVLASYASGHFTMQSFMYIYLVPCLYSCVFIYIYFDPTAVMS
jgi:hypothetical protein